MSPGASLRAPLRTARSGRKRQAHHALGQLGRRNELHGLAVDGAEGRAQHLVTAHDLREAALERGARSSRPSSRMAIGRLYSGLSGSSRSRNQRRCCANDSGRRLPPSSRTWRGAGRSVRPLRRGVCACASVDARRRSRRVSAPRRARAAAARRRKRRARGRSAAWRAASGRRGRRNCPPAQHAPTWSSADQISASAISVGGCGRDDRVAG